MDSKDASISGIILSMVLVFEDTSQYLASLVILLITWLSAVAHFLLCRWVFMIHWHALQDWTHFRIIFLVENTLIVELRFWVFGWRVMFYVNEQLILLDDNFDCPFSLHVNIDLWLIYRSCLIKVFPPYPLVFNDSNILIATYHFFLYINLFLVGFQLAFCL